MFDYEEYARLHALDDEHCTACWQGYPRPCACGGLIHAEPTDSFDDIGGLTCACDRCGDLYEEARE